MSSQIDCASALAYHLLLYLNQHPETALRVHGKSGNTIELSVANSKLGPAEDGEEYGGTALLVAARGGAPTLVRSRTGFELLKQLLLLQPVEMTLDNGQWAQFFQRRGSHRPSKMTLKSFLQTVQQRKLAALRGSSLPERCFVE